MSHIRYIEESGRRFALVPTETCDRMVEDLDALDDLRAYDRARAARPDFYPAALVDRLLAGENPVKVFREHRGLTRRQLAEAAGLAPLYISRIETGRRGGTVPSLKAIAAALAVSLDLLI